MKHLSFLIVIFAFLFSIPAIGQSDNSKTMDKEKFSIGIGMGIDYSLLGLRFSYYTGKRFGIIGGVSPIALIDLEPTLTFAKIGVEYKFKEFKNVFPYLNLQFGINRSQRLEPFSSVESVPTEEWHEEVDYVPFYGPVLGTGIKIPFFKHLRSYCTLGLSVAYESHLGGIPEIYADYNEKFKTSYAVPAKNFKWFPTVALTYIFSEHSDKAK